MKELLAVLIGMLFCVVFYVALIYPKLHTTGGASHTCYDRCYDDYKEMRNIAVQEKKEVEAYNEANGIVVAEPSMGEKLWVSCSACHGSNGEGGLGPRLAGQSVDYIADRLLTYKDRGIVGKQSNMMWGQASYLSEKDINDVSKYIAEEL
jgi:cytochrome c553